MGHWWDLKYKYSNFCKCFINKTMSPTVLIKLILDKSRNRRVKHLKGCHNLRIFKKKNKKKIVLFNLFCF